MLRFVVLIAVLLVSAGCSASVPAKSPAPAPTLALPALTMDPRALSPEEMHEWAGEFYDCI